MAIGLNNNRALLFLAALLTLSASGDDINFLRLAWPSGFVLSPVGSLPLDDENTDFVRPSDSQDPQHELRVSTLPAARSVETIHPVPTSSSSAPLPSAYANHLPGD